MPKEKVRGTCQLCLQENVVLVNSHIIPSFVFNSVKEKCEKQFKEEYEKQFKEEYKGKCTVYFRRSDAPKKRVQNGLKKSLLCEYCDGQRLSDLETMFARDFFNPVVLQGHKIDIIENNDYLLKFCVSILWRVLLGGVEDINQRSKQEDNVKYKKIQIDLEKYAENWRKFLLDEKDSIDEKIYFFKLNYQNGIDSSLKEYIEHSIDKSGFFWSGKQKEEQMVYVKLDSFIIIATLTPCCEQVWIDNGIYPINYAGNKNLVLEHQYDKLPDFVKHMIQYQAYQYEKIVINTFTKNE